MNSSTMGAGRGRACAGCFDQTGRVREVYLHVGPLKTGSTFLQDLLWRHRDNLARQGYHHPGAHANEMWLATNDLQDGAFVNYEMPQASGVWAQVCQRVLAYDGRSVISHEVLGLSTEEHIDDRIVRSLTPARLQVIVMARSLAAMLPSLWQESVKSVGRDGVELAGLPGLATRHPCADHRCSPHRPAVACPHTRRADPRRHGAARRHRPSGVARSFLRRARDRHDLMAG